MKNKFILILIISFVFYIVNPVIVNANDDFEKASEEFRNLFPDGTPWKIQENTADKIKNYIEEKRYENRIIKGEYKNDNNKSSNEIIEDIKIILESQCALEISEITYTCPPRNINKPKKTPNVACGERTTLNKATIRYKANCGKVDNENPNNNGTNNNGNTIDEHVGETFCADIAPTLKIFAYLIIMAKILVPFILITMATLDYLKAVVDKNDEIFKKQSIKFGKRVLAGIIIFFIPTFINLLFLFVDKNSDYMDNYIECSSCLLDPKKCQVNASTNP